LRGALCGGHVCLDSGDFNHDRTLWSYHSHVHFAPGHDDDDDDDIDPQCDDRSESHNIDSGRHGNNDRPRDNAITSRVRSAVNRGTWCLVLMRNIA
jgi:hypothetical protein